MPLSNSNGTIHDCTPDEFSSPYNKLQPICQNARNAFTGMSIPQRRHAAFLAASIKNIQCLGSQLLHIITDQYVSSDLDSDWPFRVGARCQAGDAQIRSLLLDPTGVGDHYRGTTLQGEEFQVGNRIGYANPIRFQTKLPDGLTCTRMHRKDHRQIFVEGKHRSQNLSQHLWIINVCRAVQSNERVLPG